MHGGEDVVSVFTQRVLLLRLRFDGLEIGESAELCVSSGIRGHLPLLEVGREHLADSGGADAAVNIVVDGDGGARPQAQAAGDFQREHPVLGGFAHVDAQLVSYRVQYFQSSGIAGGPEAYPDDVFATRNSEKKE